MPESKRFSPEQIAEIREKANYDSGWAERLGVFALLSDREELEAERADQDKLLKSMAVRNDEDAARIEELEAELAKKIKAHESLTMHESEMRSRLVESEMEEDLLRDQVAELERELVEARELTDKAMAAGLANASESDGIIDSLKAKAQAYEKVLREYRRLYLEDADMHAATPAKLALDTKALLPEQPQESEE